MPSSPRALLLPIRVAAATALLCAVAVACSSSDDASSTTTTTTTTAKSATEHTTTSQPATESTAGSSTTPTVSGGGGPTGPDCYVQLYVGNNYDGQNYKVTEPGRHATLSGLPGADMDWTGKAESLKVGAAATATVWADKDFGGDSRELKAGVLYPVLGFEPSSIEMFCS